jgi:8-oxo-dGTP diphosphatase
VPPNIPSEYKAEKYEHPSVTVDIVVFSVAGDELLVLLIKRRHAPFEGTWALPGGFVGMKESLEDAAARELAEETDVAGIPMEQLHTFGDPDRDPRMRVISVAYLALVQNSAIVHRPGDDAVATGWYSIRDLPRLAFDHLQILEKAIERLRLKIKFESGTPDDDHASFLEKVRQIKLPTAL